MKNLVINDRGVFEQETRQLTVASLTHKRRQCQNRIVYLRGKIQDLQMDIQQYQAEIEQQEKNLQLLNGPVIESYISKEKQRVQEAHDKAQALLKECIGEDFYSKLQDHKKIVFTARDNITYKIENTGRVYRRVEDEWKLLCIIRPNSLPLPDFLLSLFVNIRENPTKYPLKRHWR